MDLVLENLTKQYKDVEAVKNLSLTFTEGVYGFLGANGAGKTTLFKMICGLTPPTDGSILVQGVKADTNSGSYLSKIGYLPQNFGYYPNFSAIDYLRYMAAIKGVEDKIADKRISELLSLVSLESVSHKKVKGYSGGMKRRLGIAQALLNHPQILILDEPTAGLDPKERVYFRNIISTLSKNAIILLSTHIASDIEYVANKIIIMNQGEILANASLKQLIENIDSCVWECNIPSGQEEDCFNEYYRIAVNNDYDNGNVKLRILSKESPMPEAIRVTPTLEDIYLYYFR